MIKLIASDLDGTLMSPDHLTVSDKTKKALFSSHEKGIKIAIATGRALSFTAGVTAQIPFADMLFAPTVLLFMTAKLKSLYITIVFRLKLRQSQFRF